MRYCKKCVMPDTRPGIHFNEEGICQACVSEEQKNDINWDLRYHELETLCKRYRGMNGNGPDCIIAVSGGKDSHFQTYVMKELMGMHPLLVSVEDNFEMTRAGAHNIDNISEQFGCEMIKLKPNLKLQKKLMRKTFEKYGKPTWYLDRLIYTFPIRTAINFKIPLVIYGENINYEYGGNQKKETYSALDQINNGVASDIPWEELIDDEIKMKDLYLCTAPTKEELSEAGINPIYLSYFMRWNSYKNYQLSSKLGFQDLSNEWDRTHHAENFDQIDTVGYIVHSWMKYPKYGHQAATDYASKFIRYGLLTRDEAARVVKERDHRLDRRSIDDFCRLTGYSVREFWEIVDRHYNRDLFQKNSNGEWKLKTPVWQE